jgi:energy-coupling factor transporter ATP-binding protein EcfA2
MSIKLSDITVRPNGAKFYTADLHIHSYGGSHDVSDATMTVEAIADEAVKAGIGVIAITDHNTDRNTERSIEYAQKYAGQLLVLAATEITCAQGHLLVYFDPLKPAALHTFIGQLSIVSPGTSDSHTTWSMADVISEAERLGGISVGAHIDKKSGFEGSLEGYPNWKKDIVLSPGLRGVEVADAKNLVWYSDDDESNDAGANRKKLLNARGGQGQTAAKRDLAHVQNSDSHSMAGFKAAMFKRTLTRYKMNDLTFEGFRTAVCDPLARVRAIATLPLSVARVRAMAVFGGFLADQQYHFNNNLNCFIGGRGTGKSTALRCLAYGLGLSDDLENRDDCPEMVVVYCEDANGILYRYERTRGDLKVQAKEDKAIEDVPQDSFGVELYSQGELTEVAKDPIRHPARLQDFLDRHIHLRDLAEKERELLETLRQNAGQLGPLETKAAQLPAKTKQLEAVKKKLQVAEQGKLSELAAQKTRLAAEQSLQKSLDSVRQMYGAGLTLKSFLRDFANLAATAGELTGDAASATLFGKIKILIDGANALLNKTEKDLNAELKLVAGAIELELNAVSARHQAIDQALAVKFEDLRTKGLSGSIAELQLLLRQRSDLVAEIGRIETENALLAELRTQRLKYLADLEETRLETVKRRKGQLLNINKNLARAIEDYTVAVVYDQSGVADEFKTYLTDVMQGSYFGDEIADRVCAKLKPSDLAVLVAEGNHEGIASQAEIDPKWAAVIVERFKVISTLHKLQTMWKPPKPTIVVRTKGGAAKLIPVTQLSDGQKHTILLTIALLAESSIPLVIDQPEDDLDNAFIFSSVVHTLRDIKERRQVILVTHNANIAVLGDAELIFPMRRDGDRGVMFDFGSIDKTETKGAAQKILEGGKAAFLRRMDIYGH